jgi:hypothetical protein
MLGLGVFLTTALWAFGGTPQTQTLKGEVTDEKGSPLAGAVCTLTGPALPEGGRSVTTEEKGTFEFTGLTAGSYELTCASVGYEPVVEKELLISETQTPYVQVALPKEVVVRQKVEVSAKAETVSQQSTAPPATLTSQQLRSLPLVQQRFLAALPLVPGVVRTPDGRISIKGVVENQGLMLVDSAETVDPVTGSFSIQVPIDAVESVEVHKTAYPAQFGRFSGGLTSVQTKAPLSNWHWELNDLLPSPRIKSGHIVGIADDVPRAYLTGPLYKDKLSFMESFMYDINNQPVRGLAWPHNEIKKQGFDSFTDMYYILSPQHLISANLKLFPERVQYADINSLVPQPASSDYGQRGFSVGVTDRHMSTSGAVLTTLFQYTDFSSYAHGQGPEDMLVTPNGWDGNFFNAWTRSSAQQEVLQNYQFARRDWLGRHEIKVGGDFIHRTYSGVSTAHPVRLLRPDGTTAELIDFQKSSLLAGEDTELAAFAQDHWAFNDQVVLDMGLRFSGQTIGNPHAFAPRLGLVYSPGREGKTIIRSGIGLFYDRVPLLAGDFTHNLTRTVTQYDPNGNPLGPPVVYQNAYEAVSEEKGIIVPSGHHLDSTPYNVTWNAEVDQEIRPNVIARVSYLTSRTYDQFIVEPLPLRSSGPALLLTNTGGSRYHELEGTLRARLRESADFNISYVHSLGRGDLNTLSSLYIPFEQPVIRPNFFSDLPTNVPHRVVTWGRVKIPWKITASPILDIHTGFPYSAVDVLQNYVGTPDTLRFPTFVSLDMQLSKDFHLILIPWAKKHMFRGSLRIFNVTNHGNFRDVYNNISSPFFGQFAGFQHRSYDVALDIIY